MISHTFVVRWPWKEQEFKVLTIMRAPNMAAPGSRGPDDLEIRQ
jgi:hypothetical protein